MAPAWQSPTDHASRDPAAVAAAFCDTLIDEWIRCGVRLAIVSPGSRSTPMALAVSRRSELRTEVVLDERSAGFSAVGYGLATRAPAVVLCTSGTAAAEYHASVVEASQACVPMIVVTADRPPELHGVGAPQTMNQRDLYGEAVRWYCEPGPPEPGTERGWRYLARDAWYAATADVAGPVHVNLAFREPLIATPEPMPPPLEEPLATPVRVVGLLDEQLARLASTLSGREGVIVAGARAAFAPSDVDAIFALADRLRWPVLADHLSGCRVDHPLCVWAYDPLLRVERLLAPPEVALRIGGLSSSKALDRWLAGVPFQFGVDRFGECPDPSGQLSDHARVDIPAALGRLGALVSASGGEQARRWAIANRGADEAIAAAATPVAADEAIGEIGAVRAVAAATSAEELVVVSSSMPVRDLEWFTPPAAGMIVSNRGVNGIDGVVSTAMGAAMSGRPVTALVGDLAFLHDLSAWAFYRRRGFRLRVVVLDNDGGGIFSFLPQAEALDPDLFERLWGTPHGLDLAETARSFGLRAVRVETLAALEAALADPSAEVIVVASDRAANVLNHRRVLDAVADAARALPASPHQRGSQP